VAIDFQQRSGNQLWGVGKDDLCHLFLVCCMRKLVLRAATTAQTVPGEGGVIYPSNEQKNEVQRKRRAPKMESKQNEIQA
jgi:hypothetical protein